MWLILVEIIARSESPLGSKIGFMNITTWADSKEAASSKIESYLNSLRWHLVQVEKADVIGKDFPCSDNIADMIDRTRNNPNAIILGTLHSYKAN